MIERVRNQWSWFWFSPSPVSQLRFVRGGLCLVAAVYFLSCWGDVETWLIAGAPASSTNLSNFFRTAQLTGDARWMISPLFVWDATFAGTSLGESVWVYRMYLLVGTLLAIWVAVSDRLRTLGAPAAVVRLSQSWIPSLLLWMCFVGWANRIVLLAGIVEPVLSVSLAALVIAPVGRRDESDSEISWRTTLSSRLLSVQTTLIALATTATMLAAPTWWNGTGAYALVAPSEDRWIDVRGTLFENPFVFELTTAVLVVTLPLGVWLAWRGAFRRLGIALIVFWCVVVGLLSSQFLYAATIAILATTLGERTPSQPSEERVHTTAGASGA